MKKQSIFIVMLVIFPMFSFAITAPKGTQKSDADNSKKEEVTEGLICCVTKTGTATTSEGVSVEISASSCSDNCQTATTMAVIGLSMAQRIAEQ